MYIQTHISICANKKFRGYKSVYSYQKKKDKNHTHNERGERIFPMKVIVEITQVIDLKSLS